MLQVPLIDWGLRDYGHGDQIGLEKTPEAYVATMVSIFRDLRRVLRDDGTLWLNLGDSYASGEIGRHDSVQGREIDGKRVTSKAAQRQQMGFATALTPKNLVGIPWRVALALQADGWYLRSDIIWAKPNPMPESVTDRPTKAHEYIFLLSKSARYHYDNEAVKEGGAGRKDFGKMTSPARINQGGEWVNAIKDTIGRNRRTVWTVSTKPYSGAHFAVFPPDLIEPCILAGCPAQACAECGAPRERVVEKIGKSLPVSERHGRTGHNGQPPQISGNYWTGPTTSSTNEFVPTCDCDAPTVPGVVLDPFFGSGTVGQVAINTGRNWLGVELNPEYIELANQRLAAAQPALITPSGQPAVDSGPAAVQGSLW